MILRVTEQKIEEGSLEIVQIKVQRKGNGRKNQTLQVSQAVG